MRLDQIGHNHVVISGSKYQSLYGYSEKLCDFIVFAIWANDEVRLAVLELKGGNVDKDDIVNEGHEQLQNGASIADQMIGGEDVAVFVPVLAKAKTLNPMASKILHKDKYKVKFRKFRESIRVIRCHSSLKFPS